MPLLQESEKGSFSQIMNQSIVDGLANVIGKSGAQSVIINFHLGDSIMDPTTFHNAMVSAFQESGADLLEKAILKELYQKIGERFEPAFKPFNFTKEFESAKNLFLRGELLS